MPNDESSRRLRLDVFESHEASEEPKLVGSSNMLVPRRGRETINQVLTLIRGHGASGDCSVGTISVEIRFPAAELIVLARSAKLTQPRMSLRLTSAIHVDGAVMMSSRTREADATSKVASWDEALTLDMHRDWLSTGSLCIGLVEARDAIVARVPLKHLRSFMSYTLEIESEDGVTVLVTVTLRYLDSRFSRKVTLSGLKMAIQVAHPEKLMAVFQLTDPAAAIGGSTPLKQVCHSIALTAEDDAWKAWISDSDWRQQQATLAAVAKDDTFAWEQDKIIYIDDMGSSATDVPSLVFIEFYAADSFACDGHDKSLFESIGYAELQLPTRSCTLNATIHLRKKPSEKSKYNVSSEVLGKGCIVVAVETNADAHPDAPRKNFRHDSAVDLRPLWQPRSENEPCPEGLATQTRWESLESVRSVRSYHRQSLKAVP